MATTAGSSEIDAFSKLWAWIQVLFFRKNLTSNAELECRRGLQETAAAVEKQNTAGVNLTEDPPPMPEPDSKVRYLELNTSNSHESRSVGPDCGLVSNHPKRT